VTQVLEKCNRNVFDDSRKEHVLSLQLKLVVHSLKTFVAVGSVCEHSDSAALLSGE
jgi:hypothetical protein